MLMQRLNVWIGFTRVSNDSVSSFQYHWVCILQFSAQMHTSKDDRVRRSGGLFQPLYRPVSYTHLDVYKRQTLYSIHSDDDLWFLF